MTTLASERFNTEVAATLATLVSRRHRMAAVRAIVPLQVMFDYLDSLTEEPVPDPLASGRQLFSALIHSVAPEHGEPVDYYRNYPGGDDGGYLAALVDAAHGAFGQLPHADVVAPIAQQAALRCGEAETRTHATEALGTAQLRDWATARAEGTGLSWWEYTAGGTGSVLSMHALIAAATAPATRPRFWIGRICSSPPCHAA